MKRRAAFKKMLGDIMVSVSEMRGHKHCSLKELEKLDLEKFKKLVPVIVKKFELSLKTYQWEKYHRESCRRFLCAYELG